MTSQLANLEHDLCEASRGDDDSAKAWLSQLLVIKSAGYLEQTAILAARAHVSTLAVGSVRSYGLARIENYFGPKVDTLRAFVGRFDKEWADEFDTIIGADDARLRTDITGLLAARDQIAHGRSHNVGPVMALQYCESSREVSDWLILRLNPL